MNRKATRILRKAEFRALAGRGGINLLFLTGVFLLSLFAIGGTKGVLTFLQERMNDPFVQLVGIDIPYNLDINACNEWVFGAACPTDNLCAGNDAKECSAWREEFGIADYVAVFQAARYFSTTADGKGASQPPIIGWVGNISEQSGLYACVQARPENFVTDYQANPLFSAGCTHGLLLSEEFAEKLDYDRESGTGYIYFHMGHERTGIPLPVAAIVSNLPEEMDVVASEHLFKYLYHASLWYRGDHPLHPETQLSTTHILIQDTIAADYAQWKSEAWRVWPSQSHHRSHAVLEFRNGATHIPGPRVPILEKNPFFLSDLNGTPDHSFVFFENLNRVADYRDTLRDNPQLYTQGEHKILLDTTDVEAKQNLATFESVARTMSWALLILGVIIIMLYLGALFNNHLESNEQNLGTLQAFGFANRAILRLYIGIGLGLILSAFTLSYGVLIALGTPLLQVLLRAAEVNLFERIGFEHAPLWQLATAFLLLPALAIGIQVRKRLVGATPGDLIYKRHNS